jgi:hypothetical protein
MKSSQVIGIVLILVSLIVGYIGFNKIADNTKEINVLGVIKINASDEEGKQIGYAYVGAAILLLAGGIYVSGKNK